MSWDYVFADGFKQADIVLSLSACWLLGECTKQESCWRNAVNFLTMHSHWTGNCFWFAEGENCQETSRISVILFVNFSGKIACPLRYFVMWKWLELQLSGRAESALCYISLLAVMLPKRHTLFWGLELRWCGLFLLAPNCLSITV